MNAATTSERVAKYFRALSKKILATSEQVTSGHSGLAGGHREAVCREYLELILPARYAIGRGIVHGILHRSREADIVLWDASNFPRLQMADHTFFFAESVRAVLEVKSCWSTEEFQDIRTKAGAAASIITMGAGSLADELDMIRLDLAALHNGREHEGMLITKPRIATGAIILKGGQKMNSTLATSAVVQDADHEWPDVMLLLQPGKVVLKTYRQDEDGRTRGRLEFYSLGDDALLRFTSALLELLSDRSVHTEGPLYFEQYCGKICSARPEASVEFPIRHLGGLRMPLWRSG